MITIKTIPSKYGEAEINVASKTPHTTLLLGCEMLIEAIIKETGLDIDFVLADLKRIYERDNIQRGKKNE